MTAVWFSLAAAGGALVRWRVGELLPKPLGTLLVNVAGAFALGLLDHATPDHMTVIGMGALGALTTFSTLSNELREIGRDSPPKAALYLGATLTAGIAAAAAGLALAS